MIRPLEKRQEQRENFISPVRNESTWTRFKHWVGHKYDRLTGSPPASRGDLVFFTDPAMPVMLGSRSAVVHHVASPRKTPDDRDWAVLIEPTGLPEEVRGIPPGAETDTTFWVRETVISDNPADAVTGAEIANAQDAEYVGLIPHTQLTDYVKQALADIVELDEEDMSIDYDEAADRMSLRVQPQVGSDGMTDAPGSPETVHPTTDTDTAPSDSSADPENEFSPSETTGADGAEQRDALADLLDDVLRDGDAPTDVQRNANGNHSGEPATSDEGENEATTDAGFDNSSDSSDSNDADEVTFDFKTDSSSPGPSGVSSTPVEVSELNEDA